MTESPFLYALTLFGYFATLALQTRLWQWPTMHPVQDNNEKDRP